MNKLAIAILAAVVLYCAASEDFHFQVKRLQYRYLNAVSALHAAEGR